MRIKVIWSVQPDEHYVKVYHSRLGLICTGVLQRDGRVTDIAFLDEANRRSNMIRMPAMAALQNWERNNENHTSK